MQEVTDELLKLAASQLYGAPKRKFMAEVCQKLCRGNVRQAEYRYGWGRETVAKGIREQSEPSKEPEKTETRGKKRTEEKNPQLALDIRAIVEPHTQCDPELKSERLYTNFSAAEVRQALLDRGYQEEEVPSERTIRNILNRMNYRLKRIQKGKPLKKTQHTDAIFENLKVVKAEAEDDAGTLEISIDTKTKVKLGEYSQGGKNANGQ